MKLTYLNVFNKEIPSFAYLICEDEGKLFVPVFDNYNTVLDFKVVDCTTPLIKVRDEQQIEIERNAHGLFAYYYNDDNIFIADAEELIVLLLELSKKQNLSDDYLRSFEAFAKKYDVFVVYLEEYYKQYGYSSGTVNLIAHAVTDNTNVYAKKWAHKTWTSMQKHQVEVSNTMRLNRTLEGGINTSFEIEEDEYKKILESEICYNSTGFVEKSTGFRYLVNLNDLSLKEPDSNTEYITQTALMLQNPLKNSVFDPFVGNFETHFNNDDSMQKKARSLQIQYPPKEKHQVNPLLNTA